MDGGWAAIDVLAEQPALRVHDDAAAELKRMYVRPIARGRGVADQLVESVVGHATANGCRSIWLETMRGAMDAAIVVYRRNGFVDAQRPAVLAAEGVVVLERPVPQMAACR